MGGGLLSWTGRGSSHQQRQKQLMLKQLTELLLRDGGIPLLLGLRGAGEEGELRRFISDARAREQFLVEAAPQCQEAGLYEKKFRKELGPFRWHWRRLINASEAICSLSRGRLDGDIQTAGLIHSGNEILEMYKYYGEARLQDREHVLEQQTVLRQLEAILHIHKLARAGQIADALREVTKHSFFPLDPRGPDVTPDALRSLSSYVQACVPDLLKVAISCMDNVTDTDGLLSALRSKIANIVANNMSRNWPRDLYNKVHGASDIVDVGNFMLLPPAVQG